MGDEEAGVRALNQWQRFLIYAPPGKRCRDHAPRPRGDIFTEKRNRTTRRARRTVPGSEGPIPRLLRGTARAFIWAVQPIWRLGGSALARPARSF